MIGRPDRRSGRGVTGSVLAAVLCVLAVTGCGSDSAPRAAPPAAVAPTGSPAPAATPAPLVLAESRPVRVQIPAIGVDSELMDLGVQDDGTLEVPPTGFPAGWFTGAPTPGELGPAVIAGHVDWAGSPGVFARLHDLVAGDEVSVAREDGSTAVFRVSQVGQFAKDAFPTAAVYGDLDHAGLRVITCGGAFDAGARSYLDNTVVFADLVGRPAA
ncbi:MAG: putative sortase-like protein [Modestobacter sp.]|nr:putative sortase-like protein [Modestobacter sp.]